MLAIVQIWDAQKQEVTRRVGATSRRIASKIAKVLHHGKTVRIVPKADATPDTATLTDAQAKALMDGDMYVTAKSAVNW